MRQFTKVEVQRLTSLMILSRCPGTPTKRSGDAKSGVRRPSLRTPPTPEPQARSSRLHRHTHSAMAGFADLTQVTQQPPLAEASTSAERVPLPEPAPSEEAAQQAAPQSVQTRGRSKARDRRSSSRRAYSPPRGAARREPSQGTVNNISPISPLSSPISISRGRRDRLPGDTKTSVVSTQDDDAREGWSRGHGRGRSIRRELQDTCEMAWPGYGHDEDSYRDRRATQVPARLTTSDYPGWDDVEGLELEGEELVKPSRARAVSPRSPVDSLADDESSLSGSLGSAA